MKIRDGFVLRKVAGKNVVIAIGEASRILNGMIQLNETGAFLWEIISDGAEKEVLVRNLQSEYGVSEEQAAEDLNTFLEVLNRAGCLEE